MGKIAINFKEGSLAEVPEIVVGIDLGTTNSLIAYMHNGNAIIIPDQYNLNLLVPSIISVDTDNQILIGSEAKKKLIENPEETIYSVKRLMGKSYTELSKENQFNYQIIANQNEQSIKIKIKDKFYDPIELSAMILSHLKQRAESVLSKKITRAVVTVPSYFNDKQRQATRDAGKLAGLDVLRIVNEPTAASLAYGIGLDKTISKNIAVYDLGGGTFDISILRIEDGIFDVLSTHGDTMLGGDDIDHAIIEHWLSLHPNINLNNYSAKNKLRLFAEEAKIICNNNLNYSQTFQDINLLLTTHELNTIAVPWIQRTIESCKQAIKDSKINLSDIDEVIMVGGSTRLHCVQDAVSIFFNKKINISVNPDEVVALGAAIQADILTGNNKEFLLLDVTPLSLGIETIGGLMDTIIPRNSKIPTSQARSYTTSKDGQKNLKIAIYQGERELVSHNRKLDEFILTNIPPMPAGIPKIEIQFLINPDGIVKVKAKELRTNTEQSIEIKSQLSISEEQMSLMLIDSIKNAKTDIDIRSLIEIKNEANYILLNYQRFKSQNEKILSLEEIEILDNSIHMLNEIITSENKNEIQTVIDQCNAQTESIAHRIMDISIQQSLTGQNINQNYEK